MVTVPNDNMTSKVSQHKDTSLRLQGPDYNLFFATIRNTLAKPSRSKGRVRLFIGSFILQRNR